MADTQFQPRRGLRGGHRQTIASFLLQRRIRVPVSEERLVEVEPGVQVLCHCHWQTDRQNALTLITLHGLEGSSDSQYMLGIAEKGLAAGMNVIRMNQRNCGGTEKLAPTLYHSGRSHDVAAVADSLIKRDRISRFVLAGFSMGGNLVLKTAGEWGRVGAWAALAQVQAGQVQASIRSSRRALALAKENQNVWAHVSSLAIPAQPKRRVPSNNPRIRLRKSAAGILI